MAFINTTDINVFVYEDDLNESKPQFNVSVRPCSINPWKVVLMINSMSFYLPESAFEQVKQAVLTYQEPIQEPEQDD